MLGFLGNVSSCTLLLLEVVLFAMTWNRIYLTSTHLCHYYSKEPVLPLCDQVFDLFMFPYLPTFLFVGSRNTEYCVPDTLPQGVGFVSRAGKAEISAF